MALPKIIVILGATASGKTALAISLAKEFNGEVVSADSRQIYRELTIGTAKPPGEWRTTDGVKAYHVDGVPHHLMDIIAPSERFSAAEYQARAGATIDEIAARGKLPVVAGGTGLYIAAVTDNWLVPRVPPNSALRRRLEGMPPAELQALLARADPETYAVIDRHNPRRLVRALEVALISGQSFVRQQGRGRARYDALRIGLRLGAKELDERIARRVDEQIAQGLIAEAERVNTRYGNQAPGLSSIGYRQMIAYLAGESTLAEARRAVVIETRRYAKRQNAWFKRDQRIRWILGADSAPLRQMTKAFLAG